ncbi:MAG: Ku protein [Pseudomonadota bacterium]
MARMIWKGAISFGLVHVPVALYPASREVDVDFDWLDRRSMDPVGYQRINKRTGKVITKDNIVRGVKWDDGQYVVLDDDEIKAAFPKSTQTISIEAFVKAPEIDFVLLERPYYLEPQGKADRVYALLREAMRDAGVLGVARLVMHSKEHLALLIAGSEALMLNTIRWSSEVRSAQDLALPPAGKAANQLKPGELKMAAQLVEDMTEPWHGEAYTDTFAAAIAELVEQKAQAGKARKVRPLEDAGDVSKATNVVDLTELLARSLEGRKNNTAASPPASRSRKTPPAKTARSKASPKRPSAKIAVSKRQRA